MFRNIDMRDLTPTMFDNKETVQNSEGESRHGEEVHGRNDVSLIAQKHSPEFAFLFARRQAMEIARNGVLLSLKSKLKKFN